MSTVSPNSTRILLREEEYLTGALILEPLDSSLVADGYVLVVKAAYAESLERRLAVCESAEKVLELEDTVARLTHEANTHTLMIPALERALTEATQELSRWREGGLTEDLLRKQDGYLKVGKGCVLIREDDHTTMRKALEVLQQVHHQLATDNDLTTTVSAPQKYAALEQAVRAVLDQANLLPPGSPRPTTVPSPSVG